MRRIVRALIRVTQRVHANRFGWTFVETLIVVTIMLVMTAGVGFVAIRAVGSANVAAARSQIQSFTVALNAYLIDNGRYPSEAQGLGALWEEPRSEPAPARWSGPYIERAVPPDPWGGDYVYENPGPNGLPFAISSFGADGVPGGLGADRDINSWEN